jgi:6-phosphogluconolactonase
MKTFPIIKFVARVSILLMFTAAAVFGESKEEFVYFGTFPRTGSKGIYVSRLDLSSGKVSEPELAAETKGPGFLAIHPNHKFLYAVGDPDKAFEKPSGAVSSFSIDSKTGKLTLLNQLSSVGKGPAHLSVDRSGKCVLVANYGGGNIAALPIQADGRLSEATTFIQHTGSSVNPQRQKEPHAHSINVSPDNKFAFVADLGLDKIMIYKLDPAKGTLVANNPPSASVNPGAGPRHFAFHPDGKFAYVINEIQCTVTGFSYDAKRGDLKEIQTVSTLPEGVAVQNGFSTAEVQVHPSGKFLYGSNRGHDTIAVFELDAKTGKLKLVQNESTQGNIPRNFGIDPTGQFLLAANQNTDNVTVFRIDSKTGRLSPTGQKLSVLMPVCVKFLAIE